MTGLFTPYKLKQTTLRNRIVASPMCQYMAQDGMLNDWHTAHYTALAKGGCGLVIVEATAVSAEGRITPGDAGLWTDAQVPQMRVVAEAIKNAGAVAGIQLGHAGRKAGCLPPWQGGEPMAADDPRAWQPIAPSAVPFLPGSAYVPMSMTIEDIARTQEGFAAAAERAHRAGFEWLELHFAHGFLAQTFLSKHANHRTDCYGGSRQNRARFLVETVATVRRAWPAHLPLTARVGVVEFGLDEADSIEESIALLKSLKDAGLDFVDVGLALTSPGEEVPWGPNFMIPLAAKLRVDTGLPVATSWMITDAREADRFVADGYLDLVFLARSLLANPHWPYRAALALGIDDPATVLPTPYAYWLATWPAAAGA